MRRIKWLLGLCVLLLMACNDKDDTTSDVPPIQQVRKVAVVLPMNHGQKEH